MATPKDQVPKEDRSPNRQGGQALYERYGSDHMSRIGARGAETVRQKYGLRFYSEIAYRKRGQKRKQEKAA